jgi:nucleoside-diphosphate-sugar epimerase
MRSFDGCNRIESVEQLEEMLSRPTDYVVDSFKRIRGDVIVLGVGGKMGPTLARMARRAADEADGGTGRQIIGVSRFTSPAERDKLERVGVKTIAADLLDMDQLNKLPDIPNVVYMAGMKFGTTGQQARTWAMNAFLPGTVAMKFRGSRIAVFSTGNVYPLAPVTSSGSREADEPGPIGEYAMSCLGRERVFEHFSRHFDTPMTLIRLTYAVETRYGVLVDLATKVWNREPVDLSNGCFKCMWQGDANAMALASLGLVASPPTVLNVVGGELLKTRQMAEDLGRRMGRPVTFTGVEGSDAYFSDSTLCTRHFGRPNVRIEQLLDWVAGWVSNGRESLGKPTHFEVRDGKY